MIPEHRNDEEIRAFFDQWDSYARIIRHDYMAHAAIIESIRSSLVTRSSSFSVLDLGCGDGSVTARAVTGLPIRSYTGVDVSEGALEAARRTFVDSTFPVRFVQSDLSRYVKSEVMDTFDVVIVGFTVHHLRGQEKPGFFADLSEGMVPGGSLYLYDVFRREDETRERYLTAYAAMIRSGWDKIPTEGREAVIAHILEHDFPMTFGELATFTRSAGFVTPDGPEFSDEEGFHRLYRFEKS